MMNQIKIAARDSPLSIAQTKEFLSLLKKHSPQLECSLTYVKTHGDIDKTTSLRNLDKTDFFTRELDDMVLEGICDVAIHSAKDLPEPLRKGLMVGAMTKSIDDRDALVCLGNLPENPLIATSSTRREECVKELFPKALFTDVRGTIHERLEKLLKQEVHGVVIAEAALIRLNLTHLNRVYLPGETALHQGRLAIVIREDNVSIRTFMNGLDK